MHNPESVLENEMHKLLGDFEIKTDHLISPRRPDQIKVNNPPLKKLAQLWTLLFQLDHRVKLKEREKKDKYQDLARGFKKVWNVKVTMIPILISALGAVTKGLIQRLEDLEIRGRVETI